MSNQQTIVHSMYDQANSIADTTCTIVPEAADNNPINQCLITNPCHTHKQANQHVEIFLDKRFSILELKPFSLDICY